MTVEKTWKDLCKFILFLPCAIKETLNHKSGSFKVSTYIHKFSELSKDCLGL